MTQLFGDRWQVVSSLGEGGQGWTYTVRDLRGGAEALYVLKRLKNAKRAARFRREVEAIRNLSHPNVVRLIDFDVAADPAYFVMEHCESGALSHAQRYWVQPPHRALALFIEIASGVSAAHAAGIVHRDLKPDNVFLRSPSGPAVVGDFGLCLLNADEDRHTETTEAVGPRLYMAPELEDGRLENVRPSADVYSLGKLLYWLFTGRVFSREKHRDPGWSIAESFPEPMTGKGDFVLEHVNGLLDHMITVSPDARRDIDNIIILARQAEYLLAREYHPLVMTDRHRCDFCGRGFYELRVQGSVDATRSFGLNHVGDAQWFIFTCSICGHVQSFRRDMAQPGSNWLRPRAG